MRPKTKRILNRKQISDHLECIFEYPLTVIVAAMGYGKTTAVKSFLEDRDFKQVWLTVGKDSPSAHYTWDSLTRQLAKICPKPGNRLKDLGFPVDTPQRDKIISIIEEYASVTGAVLVIDDYHFAPFPELNNLLETIVRSDISGLHLVILSRIRPAMNLEELYLKGYCHLFKSELFEMSPDEIKDYFLLSGHQISDNDATEVHSVSEGWITAIYLIMQRYAATGRLELGQNTENLIELAVMSRYTDEEAHILKSLCIPDSFTLLQAAYLTENPAAPHIIHRLSEGNSFIRYDEQSDNYTMHNIFSAYLEKKLEKEFSTVALQKLYKRCGEWYFKNGGELSGLRYFLLAKEYDLILLEFEKPLIRKTADRDPQLIADIFSEIPDDVKFRHPLGFVAYAYFYLIWVDMAGGAELLQQIEQYYQDDTSLPGPFKKRIAGEIELAKSFLYFNDMAKMHELHLKAHKLLDGSSSIANRNMVFTFGSPHTLYLYHREKGKMRWLVDYAEIVYPYYQQVSNGCGTGFEYMIRAELCLETGDFDGAALYAEKATYKALSMEQISILICAEFTLARLRAAQGRFEESIKHLSNIKKLTDKTTIPTYNSTLDLCMGYLGGVIAKPEYIAPWLKSGDIQQSDILYQGMGFSYIVHAKAVLMEGNYLKLEVLCEEMVPLFSVFNNILGFLHTHILDAAAKYRLYGLEKAKSAIMPALAMGRADNFILPFAEYAPHILDILKNIQEEDKKDAYLQHLVAAATRYNANLERFKKINSLYPSLTRREKEVLKLVADGKTNREIAQALFIAEVTISKNLTSIYRKLEVTGRPAAVRKAVELKLVP